MRGFIMDGNFQAEHMKMRNPENDVPLSEGTGFMVSQKPYESHLKSAAERRQVSPIAGISADRSSYLNRGRAEHGCTCRLPGSLPAGILGAKTHTWTCKDFFPRITWICRSKTCRLQVPTGIPAMTGIGGYL
jgi:hypothetical protein